MNEVLLKELNQYLNENNLEVLLTGMDLVDLTWTTKIPIRCKVCGDVREITVKQLLKPHPPRDGLVCNFCNNKRLFEEKIVKEYGRNPWEFLSPFQGYSEPIAIRCKDCGQVSIANEAKNLLMHVKLEPGRHPCRTCSRIRHAQEKLIK